MSLILKMECPVCLDCERMWYDIPGIWLRRNCIHSACIICLLKMAVRGETKCPFCRSDWSAYFDALNDFITYKEGEQKSFLNDWPKRVSCLLSSPST